MTILDTVKSPADIKKMDVNELNKLACEIREFLINNILVTGGHLASNLGVVELTLALHKVFDLSKDRLIFDVGHQSYVHKILTGRKDKFTTLRMLNGLSGFPKPEESIYDAFGAGHASTSVSAAVGMARARDIKGTDENIIAFIGDGALTGGMAFEALNDIGMRKSKVIIILNDNEMSIEKNVGGLSAHLSLLRYNQKYLDTKNTVAEYLDKKGKTGAVVASWLKSAKNRFKFATMAAPYFESIGINYVGIIDGHNIEALTEIFERVKSVDEPVIIHTFTKKGFGYKEAEDNPDKYHGVSPMNAKKMYKKGYSEAFGDILTNIAANNKNVVAITAAMATGCGLSKFNNTFPDRVFDVGIAEEHAVTMAAGMASQGVVPVVCIYSTFLQRSYDQIIHDVCMQKLHVVFAIDRAGLVGEDGETHQGLFDMSFLSHIPNLTLLAPSNLSELTQMLDYAVNICDGPVALRYPKDIVSDRESEDFVPFKPEILGDIVGYPIITCGRMVDVAIKAVEILKGKSIDTFIVNLRTISPVDITYLYDYFKANHIFTLEDNYKTGGMGSIIASIAAENGISCTRFGFPCEFVKHGKQNELFNIYSLTPEKIAEEIERKLT